MEKQIEMAPPPADRERTFLYTFTRGIAFLVTRLLFPVRYHAPEIMDETEAPYLLIANHLSLLDPMLVAYACKRYEIRFLGKKELAQIPVLGAALRAIHMIPVDRHHSDMAALRSCVKALHDKRVLGIFPEGTRFHEDLMTPIESGPSVLALRAKAKLVPVYISRKARLFRPTDVYVGQPMDISDLCPDGFELRQVPVVTDRIRARFFAMRDEANRLEGK